MLGQTVGSYQIVGKIAEGGMGAVYRAQHALIGKQAAVKVLLPELSANQEIVNRFFNEARAATAIRHPGIVEIFDFGYMQTGVAYIVMEFLDGEPLSKRLARLGRLDERAALTIVRAVASALSAAHAKGIIHRDLKPDNIFLVPDPDMPGGERAKLLDFGIAKLTDAQRPGEASARTRTGAVMGTPTYMSPEQCRGAGEIDARSDLYSLGCILYEMLTGRPPFVAEGIGEIIGAHLFFDPDPPSKLVPTLSAQIEALTMQLLAKKPEQRVQSAAELARLLGQGSVPAVPDSFAAPTVGLRVSAQTPVPTVPTGTGLVGPATQTPTTLSGAAAEARAQAAGTVAPAKKSRTGLVVGLLAMAVVGGGVAAIAMNQGNGGGSKTSANATDPTPSTTTPDPKPDPKPAPPPPQPKPVPAVTPDAGVAAAAITPDAGAKVAAAVDASVTVATQPSPPATPPKKHHPPKGKGKGSGSDGPVPIETDL